MQPFDYTIQSQAPGDAFMQGVQQQLSLNAVYQQQQAQQQALAQAEYQRKRLQEVTSNPNAGHREYSALIAEFPQLEKGLKTSFEIYDAGQKKAISSAVGPAYAALESGQPDVAISGLEARRAAAEASGNREIAQSIATAIEGIKTDPAKAKTALYFLGAGADEKWAENVTKWGAESRTAQKFPTELAQAKETLRKTTAEADTAAVETGIKRDEAFIKQVDAANAVGKTRAELLYKNMQTRKLENDIETDIAKTGLDRDKFNFEVKTTLEKLSGASQTGEAAKLVNDSVFAAAKSKMMAGQQEALAKKFDALGGGYGSFASGAEAWAKLTGNQNAYTEARQEFERISAQQVIALLPPGPATDRDVAIIKQGFPPATADAKTISNFLNTMARLSRTDAVMQEARAQWVDNNTSLGKLRKDAVIDGVQVGAGTQFNEFLGAYAKRKAAIDKFGQY